METMTVPLSPKRSNLPKDPSGGATFRFQDKLPKLPIPELEITAAKYISVLQPLQVIFFFSLQIE